MSLNAKVEYVVSLGSDATAQQVREALVRAVDSIRGYAQDTNTSVQWGSLEIETEFRQLRTTFEGAEWEEPTYSFRAEVR